MPVPICPGVDVFGAPGTVLGLLLRPLPAPVVVPGVLFRPEPVAVVDEPPGADWMPLEEVVGKLKAAGYTAIHQIEADDGRWEGEGMKNGTRMEFSADPRTGAILTEHPDN